MDSVQDGYLLVDSAGKQSQLFNMGRRVKVGATLVGGLCLLLSILALSVMQPESDAAESMELLGLAGAQNRMISQPLISKLPHQPRLSHSSAQARKSIIANYGQGDSIEYYSPSNGDWIPGKVLAINGKNQVKISVKPQEWMSIDSKSLRKVNTFFGFAFGGSKFKDDKQYSRMKYKDVDTGPGYSWDSESMTEAYARVRDERKAYFERERKEREAEEKGGIGAMFSRVTGALDFQEDIKQDRGLLKSAKNLKKGEKLTSDEYNAVARKVGGTKGGFFGETVELKGPYIDKGRGGGQQLPKWLEKLR